MIPTVFMRDLSGYVTGQVRAGCEWVVRGEGTAHRKYDGITLRFDGGWAAWWRQWRPFNRRIPAGWMPISATPLLPDLRTALGGSQFPRQGFYDLCGPGIRFNSERFAQPVLVWHRGIPPVIVPRDLPGLRTWFRGRVDRVYGLLFIHPDGRMAKLHGTDIRYTVR